MKKFSGKLAVIFLLVILLVALIGAYLYNSNNDSENDTVTTETTVLSFDLEIQDKTGSTPYNNVKFEENATLLEALANFSNENEDFSFETESFDFGAFITTINGVKADSSKEFWSIKVNGTDSMVGASELKVSKDDKIELILTAFN